MKINTPVVVVVVSDLQLQQVVNLKKTRHDERRCKFFLFFFLLYENSVPVYNQALVFGCYRSAAAE